MEALKEGVMEGRESQIGKVGDGDEMVMERSHWTLIGGGMSCSRTKAHWLESRHRNASILNRTLPKNMKVRGPFL